MDVLFSGVVRWAAPFYQHRKIPLFIQFKSSPPHRRGLLLNLTLMSKCDPVTLVEAEGLNVSLCKCCKRIGLMHKNLLVSFNLIEFTQFSSSVRNIDFHRSAICFPDGQPYVILNTCHEDIQFCFDFAEFAQLKSVLDQADVMIQVYESLEVK